MTTLSFGTQGDAGLRLVGVGFVVCRFACLASLLAGCGRTTQATSKPAQPPAKVANVAKEDQLNTIELTPAAEQRLGIKLAAVELKKIRRVRTYGGEVTLPPGGSIIVSAPVSGTLKPPEKADVPKVGARVKKGQPVFLLLPLLSPERSVLTPAERIRFAEARNAVATSQIDAAGQVEQARVQVQAAQVAVERAERLFREQAGSARVVDEARAQLTLAQKTLQAAQARKSLADNIKLDEEAGTLSPLVIESPQNGLVRSEQAMAGEVVAAGAPLFEVMNGDPIWVKVPVYVGELAEISTDRPALVGSMTHAPGAALIAAEPVRAPPTALALASTADLYYELGNKDGKFRPGERLSVSLPLTGRTEQRGVPWSAVVQDINGGCWVYECTAPHTYVRRRVQVRNVAEGWATLENGPGTGARIVTDGAAELFGTEFGFGK